MNLGEKVEHIKREIKHFLNGEDLPIQNSIFKSDCSDTRYAELRQTLEKVSGFERLYRNTEMQPNPSLIYPNFALSALSMM
jgi:hypothetical protein